MALPTLQRKLFENDGYGPNIKDERLSTDITVKDWDASHDYPANVLAKAGGDIYRSVAASGPGTSAGAVNPVQDAGADYWEVFGKGDSVPIGTVLWLSTSTPPAGYLLCNGSAVGRATYPELFTAIGTTYGSGDGSTTFNLPDLIDKFAEGATAPGTVKTAGLPNITGRLQPTAVWDGYTLLYTESDSGAFYQGDIGARRANVGAAGDMGAPRTRDIYFSASKVSSVYGNSATVQPPALTLLPCIKAFSSVVGDATVVAGQLVNEIQSKVALDGSNASSIGKTLSTYMAHAANIDYAHYVTVSLPYVAPADGWMYFETQAYVQNPDVQVYYTLGDHAGCVYRLSWNSSTYTIGAASIVPVPKGARVYMNAGTLDKVEFLYANGSTIY